MDLHKNINHETSKLVKIYFKGRAAIKRDTVN